MTPDVADALLKAARKMVHVLILDGDPASIAVPQEFDNPNEVNAFTEIFDEVDRCCYSELARFVHFVF